MSDLPKDRLEAHLPPFTNVGVDYFGPKRGRSKVKRYGVLLVELSIWKWLILLILTPVLTPYADLSAEEDRCQL